MKQTRCVVALLGMVIGGANLHAQNPTPKSGTVVSALDLSKSSIATTLAEMPTTFSGMNRCDRFFALDLQGRL